FHGVIGESVEPYRGRPRAGIVGEHADVAVAQVEFLGRLGPFEAELGRVGAEASHVGQRRRVVEREDVADDGAGEPNLAVRGEPAIAAHAGPEGGPGRVEYLAGWLTQ